MIIQTATASAYVDFDDLGVTFHVAGHDAPSQDTARIEPTPDQADAIAEAFAEWAARARARAMSNAQPELFGLLL
jgi:hypothetical protein